MTNSAGIHGVSVETRLGGGGMRGWEGIRNCELSGKLRKFFFCDVGVYTLMNKILLRINLIHYVN